MNVTVVSLLPYEINNYQPHIIPERYIIPSAEESGISILHVSDALDRVYILDGNHIDRPEPAENIARNLINMENSGSIGYEPGTAEPGLFFVPGHVTIEQIKKDFSTQLLLAKTKQLQWFRNMVRIADDDWTRTKQHRVISDLQRNVATKLGLKREWTAISNLEEPDLCPACGSILVKKDIPICKECKTVINPAAYARLNLVNVDSLSKTAETPTPKGN